MQITPEQARKLEIEQYIARARARIAEVDAKYGDHAVLRHQDAAANVAIMEAQHHEARIAVLEREMATLG